MPEPWHTVTVFLYKGYEHLKGRRKVYPYELTGMSRLDILDIPVNWQ